MSSEIRAGNDRTYWIISNGIGYVDGVTDPNLVTTVGNGWHLHWIGSDYMEYVAACVSANLMPRNKDPNTSTTNDNPVISDRLATIGELEAQIELLKQKEEKIDSIDIISNALSQVESSLKEVADKQQESAASLDSSIVDLSAKQTDTALKLDTLGYVIPGVRISARQARLWLIQNGIDLNNIYVVIDNIEDPIIRESIKTEWEYATYVERSYPWLNALAAQLGFSEEDMDRAFQEAVLI